MGTDGVNSALFREREWTNEKVDISVLNGIVARSRLFHYENAGFYLFAKNGFTRGRVEKANALGTVTLVTFDEMMEL